MEHLALEIFDLPTAEDKNPTTSQFATLPENATFTITDTSEVFASGYVWSHSFTLNVHANAHIFGSAGDIHGARLHEQVNKRRVRLWIEGVPLYLGYLKLGDEADVDANGNVDVSFEGGNKTFEDRIEGVSAREVSVGDVIIGVALNRKRESKFNGGTTIGVNMTGLKAYVEKNPNIRGVDEGFFKVPFGSGVMSTPYVQQWPKLVKSYGMVNSSSGVENIDYTNVQEPYSSAHPFCNINICYPLKVYKNGEEISARGYTVRPGRGGDTTDGGDYQTRFNNSPNFYLLHFIDRLFKDMGIHVEENQALAVEDLKRVFMLNYGCFYEELEGAELDNHGHETPQDKLQRYGQYYIDMTDDTGLLPTLRLVKDWEDAGKFIMPEDGYYGKGLLRNVKVMKNGTEELSVDSCEAVVVADTDTMDMRLDLTVTEERYGNYSAYLAYATGENYPNVDISEIVEAMKSMFGIRLLFSDDFKKVRIVLLRNIFRNSEIQDVTCDICDEDVKVENGIRGFRMTYGKGKEDTSFFYKGFDDLLQKSSTTWKDTTDKHDYSQWDTTAEYDRVKQSVSAMNKTCYVTPVNGNAYIVKIDEEEDVLFPSLLEAAGFMDAQDGDCTGEEETIDEVQCGASPVIMNEIGDVYASLFTGDMKAPSPEWPYEQFEQSAPEVATFARVTTSSIRVSMEGGGLTVTGDMDVYLSEGYRIRLMDNYGIGNTGTPFDEADPGLCFGIMRSSGSGAYVRYFEDTQDTEGNDTWEVVPGSGAIDHPDTCDSYGRLFDYTADGQEDPQNPEGRFSLKLRAEKLNPYFDPSKEENKTDNRRYLEITNPDLRKRGLADQFYKEYSYWTRNARILRRTVRMTMAQLLSIDKTKRVRVGDVMGFIRKIEFSVGSSTGLGKATLEIMYI